MKKLISLLTGLALLIGVTTACAQTPIARSTTTNFSLVKPATTTGSWGKDINDNFDTIDTNMQGSGFAGNIQWQSGTAFVGTLDHVITSARTWTFPDRTDTLAGLAAQTFTGVQTFTADPIIGGTTPQLTIGDAGAEDTIIVFDGNSQDFHIGLDNTATALKIGLGSAVGTTEQLSFATTIIVFNEDGADYDFRIEGANNTNMIVVDAGNDNLGFGRAPDASQFIGIEAGQQPRGHLSGIGYAIHLNPDTYTDSGNSALANHHAVWLGQPTISTTNTTGTTSAATLYVENAPTVTGGGSITNPLAFFVDAGAVRFDGTMLVAGVSTHGSHVVSDTDSTDDLGATGVRWANLWVDDITLTTSLSIGGAITSTDTDDGIDLSAADPVIKSATSLISRIDSDNDSTTEDFIWQHNASTELMRLNNEGHLLLGTTVETGITASNVMVMGNAGAIQFVNNAGTSSSTYGMHSDTNDDLTFSVPNATDVFSFDIDSVSDGFRIVLENSGFGLEFIGEASSDHSAPAANSAVIYLADTGGGKTELNVRFASGAVQVIATEP